MRGFLHRSHFILQHHKFKFLCDFLTTLNSVSAYSFVCRENYSFLMVRSLIYRRDDTKLCYCSIAKAAWQLKSVRLCVRASACVCVCTRSKEA